MWTTGEQKVTHYEDFIKRFKALEGELTDEEAKVVLFDLLKSNLAFTVFFFSGVELLQIQEIILKSMFLRDSGIIVAGRGFSKCARYHDTNYLREKHAGLIPITSLFPNINFADGERWIDVNPVHLWNGQKYVDVSKVLIQPRKLTLKITTRFGHQIECADTHILRSINGQNGQCNLNWTRASQLTVGAFLPIGRTYLPDRVNKTEAMNLEEREAYLVGLILGDGCCVSEGISITSMDEEILSFIETFPCGIRIKDKKSKAIDLRLTSEYSRYLRAKYGLGYHKSYTKTIPQNILGDLNLSRFCLMGLYDTDGYTHAKIGGVGIGLTSEVLIDQIKLLLLNFGIVTKRHIQKTPSDFGRSYVLECFGQDAHQFYRDIGFRLSRKQKGSAKLKPDNFNTNFDIVPFAKECIAGFYNASHKGGAIRGEAGIKINPDQNHVSYEYVKKFLLWAKYKNINDPKLKNLQEIVDTNYFYDEIVSIEQDFADCIDFNIPNGEQYWCNGFINHNSFLISMFSLFYPIFYPGSKTCLVSANFRASRRILEYCEQVLKSPKAIRLKKCFGDFKKANDIVKFTLPNPCGSEVFALPLSSDGLRGTRANAVCVDEGLLITKEIQEFVVRPFLTGKLNFQEQRETNRKETELIKAGIIKESERTQFAKNKYMVFSSASYKFEYLYEYYQKIVESCLTDRPPTKEEIESGGKPSFFAVRTSYKSMPVNDSILDMTQINAARELNGENSDYFRREYDGQFIDISSSYFDIKKMYECTHKAGELPTLQMFGDKDSEYLLACDPSYSAEKNSDYFVFAVYLLDKSNKTLTLVHTYARAGGELLDHYKYLVYILKNFKIVWMTIDASGTEFLHGFNESVIAHDNSINLGIIKQEFDTDDPNEYNNQLRDARNEYNLLGGKIVYAQKFQSQSGSLRRMNEHLQNMIAAKKVWFGSPIGAHEGNLAKYLECVPPFELKSKSDKKMLVHEWIDEQHTWAQETKAQCAMIEIKANQAGSFSYDLPMAQRRNRGANKIRKDNYTCLLMSGWSSKIYYDLTNSQEAPKQVMAVPRRIIW